jgi:hydroxypyruvate isomerase
MLDQHSPFIFIYLGGGEQIMPKFSANLSMLFNEVEFLDRFERAAQAGFNAVEYMFPYEWPKEQLADALQAHQLEQVLFNLPAGDWAGGERGIACIPGREGEFRDGVASALEYAEALQCPTINCLAGLTPEETDLDQVRQTMVNNLQFAAEALDKKGIRFVIEMLSHKAVPGFILVRTQEALRLIEAVNHPNIRLQYDIYHMQIMEGNLIDTLSTHMARIGHIQIADNPGRHEPGTGEINYPNVFAAIDKAGYDGWIGCEYAPAGTTEEGLGWMAPYR